MFLLFFLLFIPVGVSGQETVTWQHISSTTGGIEAGTTTCDVDGDGDTDIIAGSDWMLNEVW